MSERVRVDRAASILGVTVRTAQALAQRGTIPAAKIGGVWTFSEPTLRAWLTQQEAAQCQQNEVGSRKGSTGGRMSSGSGSSSTVGSTERAFERLMSISPRKQRKGSAHA